MHLTRRHYGLKHIANKQPLRHKQFCFRESRAKTFRLADAGEAISEACIKQASFSLSLNLSKSRLTGIKFS